ncbi:collagen alpha-3(VI) chain-like [Mizuhopecten yessoensis]|uniref:collagen alpha-3(VI) chain-like n=1 Tax=Mizuhopecten yessoensis TaxID=6573 RepID=UPI000B459C9C|nr:collagen alpha-3(VI) chain-like [Mizuhopecten yessoensis]
MYKYAKVGFNKGGDTHYYAVEGSGTEEIATVVSRSNVNKTGKFVFRLNGYMARPVKVADIVFVIDSSYSESALFDSILQYIVDVTDNLTIAPNDTQVAVVSFSKTANVEFDFFFCQKKDCIHERVLNTSHLNSTSHMETGLEKARDMFRWTNGGRQSALKYVVVVSDGLVNDREKAINSARGLSNGNGDIRVVSVGLGRSVYHTVLESVAFNSSYLLAPDPSKLLDLLQWDLHDGNSTGCETKYSADMLLLVETSASQSGKTFKTVLNFLQTFLDKISSYHTNHTVTISIATHGTKLKYVVKGCQLSNLPYMMDAVKELRQSPDNRPDWDSVMTFAGTHTSYSSVGTRKYVIFVTTGLIPEESVPYVRTQLGHLQDNNGVSVVMVGVAGHTDWTSLENVYDCGFFTFSTEDVDIVSRALWNDIKSTNCTTSEKT